MPDWSYHTFFKPLLFCMKSETSRDLTLHTMNTLAKLPFGDKIIQFFGHMQPSKELEQNLAGDHLFFTCWDKWCIRPSSEWDSSIHQPWFWFY